MERIKTWLPCGRNCWKKLILLNQHHFLFMWMKLFLKNFSKMFESHISAGATEKLLLWEKPHERTAAWSYDMEGHARKCVRRYLRAGKQESGAVEQSFKSLSGWPSIQAGRTWISWRIITGSLTNCMEILVCTWHDLEDQTLCGRSTDLRVRSQNRLRHATHDWNDWFRTFITNECRQFCHVGNTAQHCRLGFIFKTQTLLATFKTQHLLLWESNVSSEAEHLSPSVGCVRNKHQYPTVLQSEIVSLDAGLRMDGLLALELWDTVIEVLRSTINTARQNKLAQGDLCETGDHSVNKNRIKPST